MSPLATAEKPDHERARRASYKLHILLTVAGLAKATYFWCIKHAPHVTRPDLDTLVKEVWNRTSNGCGYRQIRMVLEHEFKKKVSGKSVLRVMQRLGLHCLIRKHNPWRKYSSFKGVFGDPIPNLLQRDFKADHPFERLGTDAASSK